MIYRNYTGDLLTILDEDGMIAASFASEGHAYVETDVLAFDNATDALDQAGIGAISFPFPLYVEALGPRVKDLPAPAAGVRYIVTRDVFVLFSGERHDLVATGPPLFGWNPGEEDKFRGFVGLVTNTTHYLPGHMSLSYGARQIGLERNRQIEFEGYTYDHDAKHNTPENLINAAMSYALSGLFPDWAAKQVADMPPPRMWPWAVDTFKPKGKQRDLERAGAFLAAAIDLHASARPQGSEGE